MQRIGLLGGTFNPPHQGHLKLAEVSLHALGLDEVRFIPNATPPHKAETGPGPEGRLRLLEAALEETGLPFRVEPVELQRGGLSYTVDTLEALTAAKPGKAWIFLVGSDQLAGFAKWRRPERILELVSLAVAPRPGYESDELPELLQGRTRPQWSGQAGELVWVPGTDLDLASRVLREDLSRGIAPDGIPPQVMAAILRENQYR